MAGADTERALGGWLERRAASWQRLSRWAENPGGRSGSTMAELREVVDDYAAVTADLGLARSTLGRGAALTAGLEALLVNATALMRREPRRWRDVPAGLFGADLGRSLDATRGRFAAAATVLVATAMAGWWLVTQFPELAGLVASEDMIETVQGGELWTDGLLSVTPPSLLSLGIMTNNIVVALTAFTLGACYALGTLYILVLNGLLLGGVFAFTARYELAAGLFRFVVAHGLVELSAICLAAAAGIGLGEALARPGNRARAQAFADAVSTALPVVGIVVLFLVGAGLIEGYVSPDPGFDLPSRVIVGIAYECVFLAVLYRAWKMRDRISVSLRERPPIRGGADAATGSGR